MKKLITLDEASEITGVPYRSLWKFAQQQGDENKIGVVRIGKRIYLNRNSLMEFIGEGEETKEMS